MIVPEISADEPIDFDAIREFVERVREACQATGESLSCLVDSLYLAHAQLRLLEGQASLASHVERTCAGMRRRQQRRR